jgi:hypothetical protein
MDLVVALVLVGMVLELFLVAMAMFLERED